MSKTVLVLFAACVGLSLLSLHLVNQMRDGQAKITELQAQVARLESERQSNLQSTVPPPARWQIEPVTPPPAAPTKDAVMGIVVKRPRPSPPEEATFPNRPSREERMRMVREARERQRELMQDPDYREAVRLQQRSNMTRQYPGVSQELGLTAEQTEQLFDLLAEQQLRNNEQAELVWDSAEGLDAAALQERQQKMQQRWMEIQQKNDAELTAQLGPGKLQAWKDYQSTLGARHQAEQLRSTLAGRGVPLNEEANRAVVKAYAEAQKVEMQEYASMVRSNAASTPRAAMMQTYVGAPTADAYERQIAQTKKRNQRVLEALSPFLTYEQRESLQKEQEAELQMQEAQMRIMRAQSNVAGTPVNGFVGDSGGTIFLPDQ